MYTIEEVTAITPDEFERRHLVGGRPLFVRGVASGWPGVTSGRASSRSRSSTTPRHAAWRYEVRRLEAYLDEMHTPAGARSI